MTARKTARAALANDLVAFAKANPMTKAAAAKAAKPAKAAAPKQAKAAAKPAPVDPDIITFCGPDKSMKNAGKLVVKAGDETILIDNAAITKSLGKLLNEGLRLSAVKEALAKAGKTVAAEGVNGRTAPHAIKALEDSRPAKAKAAPRQRAAAPAADGVITATEKGAAKIAKVGPNDRLAIMVSSGTVAKALAHMKQADINYAARCGLITIA